MIEEIKQVFDDIRDAIIEMGGDIDVCTSPEEYDEAIKKLAGNNAVLCVPIFKSSDLKPDTPTTPLSANNPTNYPDGWSTPDGLTGNIWMSYTIVSSSQIYVPWTEPLLIKTDKDVVPTTYDDATTRTFLIFLELPDIDLVPSKPTGGTWNVSHNALEGTITSELFKDDVSIGRTTSDWKDNNEHVTGSYTWMSMGTFLAETGEIMGSWSDPMCINGVRDGKNGKDGRNGVDGEAIEFIYKLCANEDEAELVPTPESEPNIDDYVPGPNPNTRGNWCDQPMGIDAIEYRIEIMCSRKKDKQSGTWGPFVGPIKWAIWGEDGTDGDGVEYIFRIASESEVIDNNDGTYTLKPMFWPPICEDGCASAFLEVARNAEGYVSDEASLEVYQEDEFVPGHLADHPDAASLGWDRNWTDDPLDVSTSQPFEFCSIRKYNGETKQWGWFSAPVLWNKFWSGYAPVFTSFAFTRSRLKLGSMQLEGGDVSNPLPDPQTITQTIDGTQVTETINWFDTVPGPTDFPNDETIGHAPVWMTTRQFGSMDPDAEEQDQSWESPRLIADSRFHNTEYSASDVVTLSTRLPRFDERINNDYPFIDDNDPEGVNEAAWRNYCQTNGLGIWGDENDVSHPKWMATCSFISGKWTEWSLTQCKGEKGENGDGVQYVYKLFDHELTDAERTSNIPAKPESQDAQGKWIPTGWSDSPLAPSSSMPYCYCSIIKQINGVWGNFEKLGLWAKWAKDGDPGVNGHIGPKMRMRNWKTNYPNPDTEGQDGWYSGDEDDAEYYDIAIWPIAAEGITITNASSNADRLWRCKQKLPYNSPLITENSNPSTLSDYFVQAVGWDFVATKLLLADKISANQIDVEGLNAQAVHTIPTPDHPDTLDISGNEISLNNNGDVRCKISANELDTQVVSGNEQEIWKTRISDKTIGGELDSANYIVYTQYLGDFNIKSNGASDYDLLYSAAAQTFRAEFTGKLNSGRTNIPVKYEYEIELYARDQYGNTTNTWYQMGPSGYTTLGTINGDADQVFDINGDLITLDTTHDVNAQNKFAPGRYSLYLDVTLSLEIDGTQSMPSYIDDAKLYLNQVTFSPFKIYYRVTTNLVPITEIGANGFQFMIDGNNYFRVRIAPSNEGYTANSILIECVSNDTHGLQISSKGIKKYNAQTHDWDIDL